MNIWRVRGNVGRLSIGAVLVLAVLIQCSDALPTNNTVISIEPAAMDKVLGDENFNGLVMIIATWCPPCREELPVAAELYRKYRGQDIRIAAISIDADGPGVVQKLVDKLKVPFPVYWAGTKAIKHYKIVGVPTMIVVKKGEIVEKLPGLHSRRSIEDKIKNMLP